jgi:hypothetical protein
MFSADFLRQRLEEILDTSGEERRDDLLDELISDIKELPSPLFSLDVPYRGDPPGLPPGAVMHIEVR